MKKIMFIICLLLAFPIMTSAHTTVSTSTPSEGEVITETLRELTVEFAGNIENQGTLTLVNEQETISIDTVSIEANKITGSLSSPLENGNYTLTWKVASTDGHVLTGDIPFTVNIPDVENKEEVKEEAGQAADTKENNEKDQKAPTEENAAVKAEQETESAEDNSSFISTISIVVLVVLLALGISILLRKKR